MDIGYNKVLDLWIGALKILSLDKGYVRIYAVERSKQAWSTDKLPGTSFGNYPIDTVGYESGINDVSKKSGLVNVDAIGYESGINDVSKKSGLVNVDAIGYESGIINIKISEV